MSDDPATNAAPTPPNEPKPESIADAQNHEPTEAAPAVEAESAPPAAPEAEASVESVTAPDPERAPEPEPAPPPELADIPPVEAEGLPEAQVAPAERAEPARAEEPEAAVPDEAQEAPAEPIAEEAATVPRAEPEAEAPATEPEPAVESAAQAPAAEEVPPAEPEAKPAKPKRTRKPKAASATAAVATEAPAQADGADETPTAEAPAEPADESKKKWYAIKVQSGREESIKAAILRKVAIEGLEEYMGRIEIPVEEEVVKKAVRVKDKKTGEYTTQEKKVVKKKKKFHGYIFAELEFNDRILYLFRETSGVGDFLNMRGKPPVPEPMPEHEVQAMLTGVAVKDPNKPKKIKIDFEKGDKVRVREGSFANFEGEVKEIVESKDPNEAPKVSVELTFWGRPSIVEFDSSQVEKV